jgi:hypothetical protein
MKIPKEITRDIFYLSIQPSIYLSIYLSMPLQHSVGPWPLFQFRSHFYTEGRAPWTGDQPTKRPLPTHRTTQTQNEHRQTSMPWMGFEPMIPALERAKKIQVHDRTTTVIGIQDILVHVNNLLNFNYRINVDSLFKWWQPGDGDVLESLALSIFQGKVTTQ